MPHKDSGIRRQILTCFDEIGLATMYFYHYAYAMNPGDSPEESDDLTDADVASDTENEEGEPAKSNISSGWDDFPHSLQALKDGDEDAWKDFILRQNPVAENLIRGGFSGRVSREDAQDIASALYIELRGNMNEFKDLDAVGAWFVRALENDALDLIRKNKAAIHGGGKVISLDASQGSEPTDKFSSAAQYTNAYHTLHDKNFRWEIGRQRSPAEQAELDEIWRRLESCIERLKPTEQQFIRCELRQLTHEEIAKECGCGTSEVGIRLKRIHAKLAKLLRGLEPIEEKE
jgi:RNA polymerase sigma factor (sigma-70 family)